MANDKEYINELKKRDTAMPMKRYHFHTTDAEDFDICPKCGAGIYLGTDRFCRMCGQRLDRDNYAFE